MENFGANETVELRRPLVFVTVGTDSHPFHRLISWIDAWLADGAAARVRCVVQHGTARPAKHAVSRPFLNHREMEEMVARASVVVSHGGPGTIVLCAERNKRPIVVARAPEFGEIVDHHQVLFTRRLGAEGEIELVTSTDALRVSLETFLADPAMAVLARETDRGATAVRRFEELVQGLFE
ncbi:MAG: glycosyl transferase family 28 [Actinomycetota bacterium]|nr:glycosyl transferase family 28 [Actinomycetota bacterium]